MSDTSNRRYPLWQSPSQNSSRGYSWMLQDLSNPTVDYLMAQRRVRRGRREISVEELMRRLDDIRSELRTAAPPVLLGNAYASSSMRRNFGLVRPPANVQYVLERFQTLQSARGIIPGCLMGRISGAGTHLRVDNPPEYFPAEVFDAQIYETEYASNLAYLAECVYIEAGQCRCDGEPLQWEAVARRALTGASDLLALSGRTTSPITLMLDFAEEKKIPSRLLPRPLTMKPKADYVLVFDKLAPSASIYPQDSYPTFCPVIVSGCRGYHGESQYYTSMASLAILKTIRTQDWVPPDVFQYYLPVPGLEVVEHDWFIYWTFWDSNENSIVITLGPYHIGNTATLYGVYALVHSLLELQVWGVDSYWAMLRWAFNICT